jgi:hypothetical protein
MVGGVDSQCIQKRSLLCTLMNALISHTSPRHTYLLLLGCQGERMHLPGHPEGMGDGPGMMGLGFSEV